TYHYGSLTIVPAPLIVEAQNKQATCGVQPSYTSLKYGYQYNDNDSSVIDVPVSYTILYGGVPQGPGNLYGGPFQIVPGGIKQKADSNYVIQYLNGTLTSTTALTASKTEGVINCNGGTTTVTIIAAGGKSPYSGDG